MLHTAWTDEIVFRPVASADVVDEIVNLPPGAVREHHRAGVGIQSVDVARAIVFLVRLGELMLLDETFSVLLDAGTGNDPPLGVIPHGELVHVETGFSVPEEDTFFEQFPQVLGAFPIDLVAVRVYFGVEIYFRTDNVEERVRIAFGHLPCLFGVHDVVGKADGFCHEGRLWSEPFERSDVRHLYLLKQDFIRPILQQSCGFCHFRSIGGFRSKSRPGNAPGNPHARYRACAVACQGLTKASRKAG